jgi:hypothetical protein
MSQLTHIEQKLLTLSPAIFQKLGDTYLARFRNWRIQSWGAMIGADKDRTGVPDAWCRLPDGRFIFLAYTTADKDLPAKLQKDLHDCITRTQPSIAANQVESICLVFNRRCPPETAAALHAHAHAAGYVLELIGIDEIARYILEYPVLATDLIGLDLGSGQLIHAPDFISIHERQVGSTPFTETLIGRDAEQAELRDKLGTANLILVTGPAGVGKTQLVLSVAQAYCAEQPTQRQLYFIFDKKSPDFFRDLQVALSPDKQIIIVADDANRISHYLSALLAEQSARTSGTLKIIATVRDYARDSVARVAHSTPQETLEIQPLSDEAIQELLAAEPYCIRHGDYVRRIQQLSKGRPRLAIMAAKAAREAERIERLHNLRDLYEDYFGPVLDDLVSSPNPLLGQVFALMHFFRVVHHSDSETARLVEVAFGISPEQFWNAVQDLHDAELVDIHEGEIAKSADQILGNFVFYKVFLSERPQLSYSKLLQFFFASQRSRVIDTLNGCLNDFNHRDIESRFQQPIEQWLTQPHLSEKDRWSFYHVFWPFLIPQILTEATNYLAGIPWPAFEAATYPVPERNANTYIDESPIYEVLKDLCSHPLDELPKALRLFIEFTAKHPDHFPKALEFLKSTAHFDGYNYRSHGLYIPETVAKVLRMGVNSAAHAPFYQWLIGHIVPGCLATKFQGARAGNNRNSITLTTDELPKPNKTVGAWRASLWQLLFGLYSTQPELVLKGINEYKSQHHDAATSPQWRQWDADHLLPFLDANLDPTNFAHGYLVQQYRAWYHWYGKALPHSGFGQLCKKFHPSLYRLYDLLTYDQPYKNHSDRKLDRLYNEEKRTPYILVRTKKLHFKSFPSYTRLIDQFHQLYQELPSSGAGYQDQHGQLTNSIAEIFHELIERDFALGKRVATYLLDTGNPVLLTPQKMIKALAHHEPEANYALISQPDYQAKSSWQWLFIQYLPADQVSLEWYQELLRVSQSEAKSFNLYQLSHFEAVAPSLYPDLLAISLDTTEQNPTIQLPWGLIKEFSSFFSDEHFPLLKRYYHWQHQHTRHHDWNCEELSIMVEREPDFLLELLDSEKKKPYALSLHERRPLKFLWKNHKYEPMIEALLTSLSKQPSWQVKDIMKSLFPRDLVQEQKERMLSFVFRIIKSRPDSLNLVKLLFKVVRNTHAEQLMSALELIFQTYPENPDNLFEKLRLFPSMRSASGSWIPVHEADTRVWEDVIKTIDRQPEPTFALDDYRQNALRQIGYLNKQIAEEAARNFADPYE